MTHTYKGKPVELMKAWKHKGEWYYTVRAKDPIFPYHRRGDEYWSRWGEVLAEDIRELEEVVRLASSTQLNIEAAAQQLGG